MVYLKKCRGDSNSVACLCYKFIDDLVVSIGHVADVTTGARTFVTIANYLHCQTHNLKKSTAANSIQNRSFRAISLE